MIAPMIIDQLPVGYSTAYHSKPNFFTKQHSSQDRTITHNANRVISNQSKKTNSGASLTASQYKNVTHESIRLKTQIGENNKDLFESAVNSSVKNSK